LEVLLGVSHEQVSAALAAEKVFFTLVAVSSRLVFTDSQPYQGTAAVGANERFHLFLLS
jgi:hypothetical protein